MRISGISGDLLGYGHKLMALGMREGAEEAEVFGVSGRSVDIDLRKNEIELASESFHRGLGLRAVVKGAVGFSSTSDMARLESVARSAVRSARARGADESWRSLPILEKIHRPENIFDPNLERITPEECIDISMSILQGSSQVIGVEPLSGGVTCVAGTEFVLNSRGVELSEKSTVMHASFEAIAKGSDVATGGEFHNSRLMKADLEEVGRSAAEMAKSSLGGIKAETGISYILLKPIAFTEILEYTFVTSISADNIQKGRSSLASKAGEKIASEQLSMIDDGLLQGGMGSSAFDGEGVPSQITPVVKNGQLVQFLYDSYTAGKESVKSTGNATRSGYSEIPRISIRNLIVSSSEPIDLLSETKGILVNSLIGAHTANPISGDFSVEARNSFYVSPDETPRPIRSLMLAGNIFDLLKDIDVGKDVRAVGAIVTPTVRAKMKVVGS
ncbi:MAG: TldD/PmbA family protein [Methanotrichaceae archaeon]